ncbi:MAG: Uma2 family endonuclease [Bryobacterales bacterium]|nr:Uma2 family endonuclease [Bryobacterales bacterium]
MQLIVEDFESVAPVTLHPEHPPLTDDEFVAFCEQYPDCMVEVSADGEITIMPPNYPKTSKKNSRIVAQLSMWSDEDGRGEMLDSSGGFVLANGARRAADACWIRKERVAALPAIQREKFYRLCPEFLIELRSAHDRMRKLRAKMEEYMANGAQLAWLIDPFENTVTIYRPGLPPEILDKPAAVRGEGPVEGFVLDLSKIWD